MAKERTSVRMQAQIKALSEQGHSIRRIARILRLSRKTVRKFLEPAAQPPRESGGWIEPVDWEYVRQEVYGKGTTVKQIQREVAPEVHIPLKSPSIPKQIDTHTGANRQCEKSERSDAGNLFIA
jgi:predicted transcriptional regulator